MKKTGNRISELFVVLAVLFFFGADCRADDGVYKITDFGAKGDGPANGMLCFMPRAPNILPLPEPV